jgi:hypothetical protein
VVLAVCARNFVGAGRAPCSANYAVADTLPFQIGGPINDNIRDDTKRPVQGMKGYLSDS